MGASSSVPCSRSESKDLKHFYAGAEREREKKEDTAVRSPTVGIGSLYPQILKEEDEEFVELGPPTSRVEWGRRFLFSSKSLPTTDGIGEPIGRGTTKGSLCLVCHVAIERSIRCGVDDPFPTDPG